MMESLIVHEDENPFSKEYHQKCVDTYLKSPMSNDDPFIKSCKPFGRLDRFFSRDFVGGGEEYVTFEIDGEVWMSLTPFEIESHWVPIQTAQRIGGHIGIGGLGMGHILIHIMSHTKIDKITVYEKEQRVVDWWCNRFREWVGFDKIDFVVGDCREELRKLNGKPFDFFYMDIYQTLLPEEIADDIMEFKDLSTHYFFWGLEKMVLDIAFYRSSNSSRNVIDVYGNFHSYNPHIRMLNIAFSQDDDVLIANDPYNYTEKMESALVELLKTSKCPFDERAVIYDW